MTDLIEHTVISFWHIKVCLHFLHQLVWYFLKSDLKITGEILDVKNLKISEILKITFAVDATRLVALSWRTVSSGTTTIA